MTICSINKIKGYNGIIQMLKSLQMLSIELISCTFMDSILLRVGEFLLVWVYDLRLCVLRLLKFYGLDSLKQRMQSWGQSTYNYSQKCQKQMAIQSYNSDSNERMRQLCFTILRIRRTKGRLSTQILLCVLCLRNFSLLTGT